MTITEPFEVVGHVCRQTSEPARFAVITVRLEPAEVSEFVNAAKVAAFDQRFAEAAFDGIRSISQKYSWLTFRFTITDAEVHPIASSAVAFRMAGEAAARTIFKQIYKKLTITASDQKTKILIVDTEGFLVQAEVGRIETGLLQGNYDIFFGDDQTATRVHLQENVVLHEGR